MEALDARAIAGPADSVDPSSCPTCRSGSPPRDAHFEAAIAVEG